MTTSSFLKAFSLMVLLVVACTASWETYVRREGFNISYDDDGALWSDKRKQVYDDPASTTVFIGSSRIKYDLDIPTWEKLTGTKAVQLACVGSTPLPVLQNLAADKNFKGNLFVDVTEVLFFSLDPFICKRPSENLKYYKDETPAQKFSFRVNHFLESKLAFLDKDMLSLNSILVKIHIPNRPGVFEFPQFPPDFGRIEFNRQEYMTQRFLTDTMQINQVRGIWGMLGKITQAPPISGRTLDSVLQIVKVSVDKIRNRGGRVLFIRTPSSGPFLMAENAGYPRAQYWDRLLSYTGCKGIHYTDYPSTANFQCPEFSHLSRPDAVKFTEALVKILEEKEGWNISRPVAMK
jgi:hypothetical protein